MFCISAVFLSPHPTGSAGRSCDFSVRSESLCLCASVADSLCVLSLAPCPSVIVALGWPTTVLRSIYGNASAVTPAPSRAKRSTRFRSASIAAGSKPSRKARSPTRRRFFFPVLCNQCDEAPCATICPTNALFKRRDGIVDLHGDSCIGCRACMVACPYDQLFIDPNTHTAEKCNFCANRVENDLLPSCVSVCPTQCRIFGDLDDPASEVAQIAQRQAIAVRKPEKGTQPKVFYIGADESVMQPEAAAAPVHVQGRPGAVAPGRIAVTGCCEAGRGSRRLRRPPCASRGASTWRCIC